MMEKRKESPGWILRAVEIALAAVFGLVLLLAIVNVKNSDMISGKDKLEEAVRRCTVSCYALEGVYPPDLDYIVDRYGLQIDEDRYVVHYTVEAENIMPDITVTEKS